MTNTTLLDHTITATDCLFAAADDNQLSLSAQDTLSALKDAAEQLYMAAEGVSRGKPLDAPEVALCVSMALAKVREAHGVASASPVGLLEGIERRGFQNLP